VPHGQVKYLCPSLVNMEMEEIDSYWFSFNLFSVSKEKLDFFKLKPESIWNELVRLGLGRKCVI